MPAKAGYGSYISKAIRRTPLSLLHNIICIALSDNVGLPLVGILSMSHGWQYSPSYRSLEQYQVNKGKH